MTNEAARFVADQMGKPTVYLAGGFRSGWQNLARAALSSHYDLLDPRQHALASPSEYTSWDLAAIRRCHVVLAYMEESNPGGYALALEIGYAHALGKHIVLVDVLDQARSKYFAMVREVANYQASSLQDALANLVELAVSGSHAETRHMVG